jgi:hypothetical protein
MSFPVNNVTNNVSIPAVPNKSIDRNYFLHDVEQRNGDSFVLAQSKGFNKYNWSVLRNSLCDGDFIKMEVALKNPNLAHEHLTRYLKILRLEKDATAPTVFLDVSCFFKQGPNPNLLQAFPQIREKREPYILRCRRCPNYGKNLKSENSIPEKVNRLLQLVPYELQGSIFEFMDVDLILNLHKERINDYYTPLSSTKSDVPLACNKLAKCRLVSAINTLAQDRISGLFSIYYSRYFDDDFDGMLFPPERLSTQILESIRGNVSSCRDIPMRRYLRDSKKQLGDFFDQIALYLPNLNEIRMRDFLVTDEVTVHLEKFKCLTLLDLSGTSVKGESFQHLPQRLTTLLCNNCQNLSDEAIVHLKSLPLQRLDVANTQISSTNFRHLPTTLKILNLNSCKNVTDIKDVPNSLTILLCNGCFRLSDKEISVLQSFESLEYLDLSNIYSLTNVPFPKTLKWMHCPSTQLADSAMMWLGRCTKLEDVDVSETPITGKNFDMLPASLTVLNASGCHGLDDKGILGLLRCRNLKKLDISRTSITGNYFSMLPTSLMILNCSRCDGLCDKGILGLKRLRALVDVDVSQTRITGQYFGMLPASVKNLNCENCRGLTHSAAMYMMKKRQKI